MTIHRLLALATLTVALVFAADAPALSGGAGGPRPLVLAEYHVWHGLPSHSEAFSGACWLDRERPRAYDSRRWKTLSTHIALAKSMGVDGFVVDWYGPRDRVGKRRERAFMDKATARLLREAEATGFRVALLYDQGTVRDAESSTADYQARVVSDLSYAQKYFSSPAYLRLEGRPALFVFPYDAVDPFLDWAAIRSSLSEPVTLIDKDPDPLDPAHDESFDGFYAWVQPGVGDGCVASDSAASVNGQEWGRCYLEWFYRTMGSGSYEGKIAVGGVWPGFDDSLAPWGQGLSISRQDGLVFDETWRLARENDTPVVLIATWNDFEEGTDVEAGIRMEVDMEVAWPEILLRSSPLEVVWDDSRGERTLQVYRDCRATPLYSATHPSGSLLCLESGVAYEIKVWTGADRFLSRTVKIRAQDPVPGVAPIPADC